MMMLSDHLDVARPLMALLSGLPVKPALIVVDSVRLRLRAAAKVKKSRRDKTRRCKSKANTGYK